MSVNKAILIGRLGKDPELKYIQAGKALCTFTLATTERWATDYGEKQESTTWHNIVVWGKQAETMKEYLAKGMEVYVEGRIQNRSYETDGGKKYISEVVVQGFQFIGDLATSKDNGDGPPDRENKDEDDLPF